VIGHTTVSREGFDEAVLAAFAELLPDGTAAVTRESDFFVLGGNSVLGAQLVARLRRALPVKVAIRDLFRTRTAGALADLLRTRAGA
jgi:hypothetical protein